MNARSLATFVLTLGCAVVAAQGGCSSTSSQHTVEKPCTAGDEEPCTCADMTPSIQICRADGSGYDPCACGTGGSGGSSNGSGGSKSSGGASSKGGSTSSGGEAGDAPGGAAGDGGSAGSGGSGVRMDGTLGSPCEDATGCTDLSCIQTSTGASGMMMTVPGGVCSNECTSTSQCPAGSLCTSSDPATLGFCAETCVRGPDGLDVFSPDKCHARRDFGCGSADASAGPVPVCLPRCSGDDCDGGTLCDLGSGFCTPGGTPNYSATGNSCSLGNPMDTCSGSCVGITTQNGEVGICRDNCVLGDPDACSSVGPADAACLETITSPAGVGDAALCSQLCDCPSECRIYGLACVKLPAPIKGKAGYCGILPAGSNPTPNCP